MSETKKRNRDKTKADKIYPMLLETLKSPPKKQDVIGAWTRLRTTDTLENVSFEDVVTLASKEGQQTTAALCQDVLNVRAWAVMYCIRHLKMTEIEAIAKLLCIRPKDVQASITWYKKMISLPGIRYYTRSYGNINRTVKHILKKATDENDLELWQVKADIPRLEHDLPKLSWVLE